MKAIPRNEADHFLWDKNRPATRTAIRYFFRTVSVLAPQARCSATSWTNRQRIAARVTSVVWRQTVKVIGERWRVYRD